MARLYKGAEMTGYESKKAAAQAKTIDEVNWADHEPDGLAQPAQEPVAWQWLDSAHFRKKIPKSANKTEWSPVYTVPPQRPWVGLTDDEVYKIAFALEGEHWKKIADAIETKLKEKNNG
jgi:hypothetical protein